MTDLAHWLPPAAKRIEELTGLHFSETRYPELAQHLSAYARATRAEVVPAVRELVEGRSGHAELNALIEHVTVGETFFYRDHALMESLSSALLPELIEKRRADQKPLRIWSAGCCTGEEPYTLAILLRRLSHMTSGMEVEILATDINEVFLERAQKARYRSWSFRGTPEWLDRWFEDVGNARRPVAIVREQVRFLQHNLVLDPYPYGPWDLIICRNVLMYLSMKATVQVGKSFRQVLRRDGYLVVAPAESVTGATHPFKLVRRGPSQMYRRATALPRPSRRSTPPRTSKSKRPTQPQPQPPPPPPPAPDPLAVAAERADSGHLDQASALCSEALSRAPMEPRAHFLAAVIARELGDCEGALASLRSAIYLDPDFAMAHLVNAQLLLDLGHGQRAAKHLTRAQRLLGRAEPNAPVSEADGATARELLAVVAAMSNRATKRV